MCTPYLYMEIWMLYIYFFVFVQERSIDGCVSIVFPDGTMKLISSEGTETITFPDKTVVVVKNNGRRIVKMPNDTVQLRSQKLPLNVM